MSEITDSEIYCIKETSGISQIRRKFIHGHIVIMVYKNSETILAVQNKLADKMFGDNLKCRKERCVFR